MVHVIKNDPLYGAEGSFIPLRPKNKVEILTRMGKWAFEILAIYFLRLQKGPRQSDFFQRLRMLPMSSLKIMSKKALRGARKEIIYRLDFV